MGEGAREEMRQEVGRRWGQGVVREASAPGLLQSKGRDLESGFGEAEGQRKTCS